MHTLTLVVLVFRWGRLVTPSSYSTFQLDFGGAFHQGSNRDLNSISIQRDRQSTFMSDPVVVETVHISSSSGSR